MGNANFAERKSPEDGKNRREKRDNRRLRRKSPISCGAGRKILLLILALFLLNTSSLQAQEKEMNKQIREPVVAGVFYPASPDRLKGEINNYLSKVASVKTEEEIVAIISPHAGYEFSGGVAAYGFKAIEGKNFSTVIIIGPSHYVYFKGSSIYPEGYYRTPLGDVEIDKELAKKLINGSNIRFYPPAHQREHSVEAQIPFLQTVLKDFKIVPIVMGNCSYQDCLDLGKAIAENIKDKRILIVASTDLSHFHPSKQAKPLDKITQNEIRRFNPRELYQKVQTEECQLCGAMPVVATLIASKDLGADKVELLKYLHSGDVTGDNSRVVGYGSFVITCSRPHAPGHPDTICLRRSYGAGTLQEKIKAKEESLSSDEKKKLLEIAREAIESYVNKQERIKIKETNPKLREKKGVFVTNRNICSFAIKEN
ncbi:MAG: AmmeMemoRadiSam system protein B [Candidatus Omnitrophica bacterium 4484_213]|nr:MAG: AmmeMemoRadiSam system protein B [Candidatus Omnitrophica bacterium 4484_213]